MQMQCETGAQDSGHIDGENRYIGPLGTKSCMGQDENENNSYCGCSDQLKHSHVVVICV